MRSRLLFTLLSILPFTQANSLSAQRSLAIDSAYHEIIPFGEHLYAPDSIPASALARIDSLAQAGITDKPPRSAG